MRAKRLTALMAMSKSEVLEICKELEVEPLLKDVIGKSYGLREGKSFCRAAKGQESSCIQVGVGPLLG